MTRMRLHIGSITRRLAIGNETGQSLLEFALVLPVLVLFLAGLLQTGVYFYREVTLNDAVRVAAHAAITCRVSPGVVPGTVGTNAANGLSVTFALNGGTGTCPSVNAGDTLSVSGTASMGNLGFPILGSIFPSNDTKTVLVVVE